ncbi:hypothetical protein GCM10029992_48200 [Glycomyces albus]
MVTATAVGLTAVTTIAAAVAFPISERAGDGPDPSRADATAQGAHGDLYSPRAEPTGTASGTDEEDPSGPRQDGDCDRPAGAEPEVASTEIEVGTGAIGYGAEGDTDRLPMAIAATPSGRSWVAWVGTDDRIHLARLDCDDQPDGTAAGFEGTDLQDVHADEDGVVVLVTRRGDCGGGTLCGGEASPCDTMHMIRFDESGQQMWEREVTNLGDERGGYDDGARFVWWYQHHGRLAFDGEHYAAYFGVAVTVANGGCVDIHQGDRMQVVDSDGELVSGHRDAFEVGCSHSWTTRIVWDERADRFVMVCATDNGCRIAQPNPYRTVAAGSCDGTLFGGDLVRAADTGYWTAWSQGGGVRLERFTDGPSEATIDTGADSSHPHLVEYGSNRMLLAWESGSAIEAQVYSSDGGETVGSRFTIDVPDHDYQAFKSYPDGSAAYAAAGTSGDSIRIARVMPLSG